jgi:murein DD-endopeptidase MepM/ murein hydrolase activator NlpD
MQIRDRRRSAGDLSRDCGSGERLNAPPKRSPVHWRGALSLWLAVALSMPAMVIARAADAPGSTTTTTVESTTTTEASTTTTTTVESTTTTEASTTTTTSSTTTTTSSSSSTNTTVPSSTTTTSPGPDAADSAEDPLDVEDEEEEPELLPLPSILFPIVGGGSYSDTYGAPRDGGARDHKGTDIFADRGTPVVAVAGGVVERMGIGPKAGLFVVIRHGNGWRSAYVHLNNDSPGTDNGLTMGYGPGIQVGVRVRAGTIVGYVGDSGNSENSSPHVHFEMHQPDGYRANPYPALRKARRVSSPSTLATVDYGAASAEGTEVIAHLDPGTGFNSEIAVLDGHAYLGTWGNGERCPGTGVRVIDVTDPATPTMVTTFADHRTLPDTATSFLWVGNVETEAFQGRLGIVGLERCGTALSTGSDQAGFVVYDLTDPANPVALASAPADTMDDMVVGLDVSVSAGQVLLAVLVGTHDFESTAGEEASPPGDPPASQPGPSLDIYELSDPTTPVFISSWRPASPTEELEADPAEPTPARTNRLTWLDHGRIAVGLERGSAVVLDVTDPAEPVEAWRTRTASRDLVGPADLQPGALIDGRSLIVDERLMVPDMGLVGRQVVVDASESPGTPVGSFIPDTDDEPEWSSGYYLPSGSISHSARSGIVAWMSGGVRVVDLDEPAKPLEIAHFIPPPAFDPQRWWTTPDGTTRFTMVWDVTTDGGYVYASDHHSGLWILRMTFPAPVTSGPNVID